jgi:hypothetical protein
MTPQEQQSRAAYPTSRKRSEIWGTPRFVVVLACPQERATVLSRLPGHEQDAGSPDEGEQRLGAGG